MKQRVIHLPLPLLKTSVRHSLAHLSELEDFELIESDQSLALPFDIVVNEQGAGLLLEDGQWLSLGLESVQLQLSHQVRRVQESNFARALKLHKQKDHLIWDMSVGMAHDTALMRHFGARRLRGFERNPHIFALLSCDEAFLGLGVELYAEPTEEMERPEVIYFDPMYPEKRKKSAKSKKGMEAFKSLVGPDSDASAVLGQLKNWAHTRVVVKRPLYAEPLALPVSFSYESKTVRYDVYERARPPSPDHQ